LGHPVYCRRTFLQCVQAKSNFFVVSDDEYGACYRYHAELVLVSEAFALEYFN